MPLSRVVSSLSSVLHASVGSGGWGPIQVFQEMFIFCLLQDLVDGVQYKVNITALVEDYKDYKDYKVTDSKRPESVRMSVEPSTAVESKALHEKVSGSFVRL